MTRLAILAITIATAYAASFTLPVTQDFALVNQDRVSPPVVARNNIISFFNNGLASSISYFGIDTSSFLQAALISANSPVASMIEQATLVFNNFTVVTDLGGAINIQLTALNPGQNWDENTVTANTVPSIDSVIGAVDFSQAQPSIDITNFFVKAISGQYQLGLFGFQVGLPGGPVEVPSHRADANAIVVQIIYSPLVGPGGTAPTTDAPTTTAAPSSAGTTTTTARPSSAPSTTTARPAPGTPSTTAAPSAPTTTAAPGTPTTTTTAAPSAPETSAAPGTPSTTEGPTTTAAPNQPERNTAKRVAASLTVIAASIALLL